MLAILCLIEVVGLQLGRQGNFWCLLVIETQNDRELVVCATDVPLVIIPGVAPSASEEV